MVTVDLKTYRSAGFRFDGAPEPLAPGLSFIEPAAIAENDLVIDLRDAEEAPATVTAGAKRISLAAFLSARPMPQIGQRAVLACRSGLRAWRGARILQSYWTGDIALIALGDTPETERQSP
ncbi:MAG: hypothetical protein AAFY59_14570 [Pseudomonadota bacterium]